MREVSGLLTTVGDSFFKYVFICVFDKTANALALSFGSVSGPIMFMHTKAKRAMGQEPLEENASDVWCFDNVSALETIVYIISGIFRRQTTTIPRIFPLFLGGVAFP